MIAEFLDEDEIGRYVGAMREQLKALLDADHGYAGAFHIFGHGGCFGDHGHSELPSGPRDPFDLRPAHQLTPQNRVDKWSIAPPTLGVRLA